MESLYRNFYRNFYLRTHGYIPTMPMNLAVFPGDFFQVRDGAIMLLGNIFRNGIVDRDDAEFSRGLKLNPSGWAFSDGISKPYSGRGSGQGPIDNFEYNRQVLEFAQWGSFTFRGNNPESISIRNWADLQQQLIIKMTQVCYSFRELYIITESVATSDWTLAIAGAKKAELEVASETDMPGLIDIFGHTSSRTTQSKDVEYYHHETRRRPAFFKAKKLVVQETRQDTFISRLIADMMQSDEWASKFFEFDFYADRAYAPPMHARSGISLLDMLQANELNPNTALLFFRWAEANMDDIEKLFLDYGN